MAIRERTKKRKIGTERKEQGRPTEGKKNNNKTTTVNTITKHIKNKYATQVHY